MKIKKRINHLNLALQGGGAHGAYTWGVLDRMLEDPSIQFGWVSASSAGAVNAVALAAGLIEGGRAGAREKLASVWTAIGKSGVPEMMRNNPFLRSFAASAQPVAMLWSPYDFNPLGFDPLRQLLEEQIDFQKIREASPVELLIAATDVSTGRARLFRKHEMTVETVLASACLPTVHHAVEIEGSVYWDGGFSANPDLISLASESDVGDTLIVQLAPLGKTGVPKGTKDIAAQVNRLTFNAPLLRDVEYIEAMRDIVKDAVFVRNDKAKRIASHRFHLIDATDHTSILSDESKMAPGFALLARLHTAGRDEAGVWLTQHRTSIGRTSSVDLKAHFLGNTAESEKAAVEAAVINAEKSFERVAAKN